MKMSDKTTCTLCGLRPHKLPRSVDYVKLIERLEHEIRASIFAGYTIFQSGMAMGADIEGAELVNRLKREFPHIRLHCFLPCETQANNWPEDWRERYFDLLAQADEVYCLQTRYSKGCMLRRNRTMVDKSARVIAIHDGVTGGGTAYTIDYAKKKNIRVVIINPLEYYQEEQE